MKSAPLDFATLNRLYHNEFYPYRFRALVAVILLGVGAATSAALAWLLQFVVDDLFIAARSDLIIWTALAIVLIYAIKGFSTYFSQVALISIGAHVELAMKEKIVKVLMAREVSFFERSESSDLVNRISNSTNRASQFIRIVVMSSVRDGLTALFLVGYMFYQDWLLAVSTFLVAPLIIYVVQTLTKQMRRTAEREFSTTSEFMQLLYERVNGIRLVKSYRIEELSQKKLNDAAVRLSKQARRIGRISTIASPLTEMIGGLTVAALISYSGFAIANSDATPGELLSFIIAFIMAYEPVKRLSRFRVDLIRYTVPLNFYYDLLDSTPEQFDSGVQLVLKGGEIRFENVSFAYENGPPAVRSLSFTAPAGKTTALVGRSGSGKSTVFALLERFYELGEGNILIDDQDIKQVSLASLRDNMAYIPQEATIFSGTIRENITLGRDPEGKDVAKIGKQAHMEEFVSALEQGYDSYIGDGHSSLSGGQKQRLSIARAIFKDAPILLLDEATSALDSASEAIVQDAIEEVSKGKTTLVIAHRLSTIRAADQILVMDNGEIIESGTHDELNAKNGFYAELCRLQFAE